jgi:hypothetical protein
MPAYYRDTDAYGSWTEYPLPARKSLLGAICAQCPMWALATVCPCAAQLLLRRAVLENDLARYACCQGYPTGDVCGCYTCSCCTPREVQKCPSLCMCAEVSAKSAALRKRPPLCACKVRLAVLQTTFCCICAHHGSEQHIHEMLRLHRWALQQDRTNLSSPQLC